MDSDAPAPAPTPAPVGPKYLALGPGAMGFFALLGSLRDTDLSRVEEISGASAGAILGLFLALKKSVFEILELSLLIDYEKYVQPDLTSLVSNYGLASLEPVKKLMVKLCGCDPKFKDLPVKLHVSGFCLETGETVYFSRDNVPDERVVDFVAMSIAVPFLFESVRYNGRIFVDGGLVESVPMNPFLGHRKEDILALKLKHVVPKSEQIGSFRTFVTRLVRFTRRCVEYDGARVVTVNLADIFNFSLSLEDRLRMFFTPPSEGTCRAPE